MKAFFFAVFGVWAVLMLPAHAEIIEVTATATAASEYAATIAALDNAVRQTHVVEIANTNGADLSEVHISGTNEGSVKASGKSKQKASMVTKLKSWFGDGESATSGSSEQSAEYSYESKGGKFEYHDTSIERKIDMRYQGAVESYEILEHSEKKGQHTVKIKAKIKKLDEYKSPDLIDKAKYTVAVVASDSGRKFTCMGEKVSDKSLEEKVASKLVNKLTASKKLSVVDRENLSKQLKEFNLLEKDIANPDNANKLKQVKLADYLLVVKAEEFNAKGNTKTIQLTGEKISNTSGSMEISWRLIESATMEIVASGSESDTYSGSGIAACNTVMTSMNKSVAEDISSSVISNIK